jgi:hypothetical protein
VKLSEVGNNVTHINAKSLRIAAKKRKSALREIFTVLLYTVDMAKEQDRYSEQRRNPHFEFSDESKGREGAHRSGWQIAKESGQDAYEMCPVERASEDDVTFDPEVIRAVDPAVLSEQGSSAEASVSTNLLGRFNSARAGSPPPPPPPATHRSRLPMSGNKYYFRAESLANKKAAAAEGVVATEQFNLDEARSGAACAAVSAQSDTFPSRRPQRLLDCSRANASLLTPPALCEVVSVVLQACRPSVISEAEFIECFEVMVDAGLTPPVNMLLGGGDKNLREERRPLSSEEQEVRSQCRQTPELCGGKRAAKLRERAAAVPAEVRFKECEC